MIDDYAAATDEVVLAGCQAGEPEAIAVLMARHGILAELGMLRERAGMNPRELSMLLLARLSEHPDAFASFYGTIANGDTVCWSWSSLFEPPKDEDAVEYLGLCIVGGAVTRTG